MYVNFACSRTTQFTNSLENVHTMFTWRVVYLSTPVQSRQSHTIYTRKWKTTFLDRALRHSRRCCDASLGAASQDEFSSHPHSCSRFQLTERAIGWLIAGLACCWPLASVCGQIGVLGHQADHVCAREFCNRAPPRRYPIMCHNNQQLRKCTRICTHIRAPGSGRYLWEKWRSMTREKMSHVQTMAVDFCDL
jgi:hypothetical protein